MEEPSSQNVSFSHDENEKALCHPFLEFGDTETNVSLDMSKPSSNKACYGDGGPVLSLEAVYTETLDKNVSADLKEATALTSSYGYGDSPVLSMEAVHTETLGTNVPGYVKAFVEVEESSEKASPGSSFGKMQEESSVLVSVEGVSKETQHEREGDCSLGMQEVGEAERKKKPGAAEKDGHSEISLHNTDKLNQSQEEKKLNSQTVDQNLAKQEVEAFSAQYPVAVEQSRAKHEVASFSAQSTMTEAGKKKQVSNSTAQNGLLGRSSKHLGESNRGATTNVFAPWSKVDFDSKLSEPEFTMEATTWPTLAEARDRKLSSKHNVPKLVPKPASSKVEDFIPPLVGRKPPPFQKPSAEIPRQGANFNSSLLGSKYKSSWKRGNLMENSNFPASENSPSPPVQNPGSFPNPFRKVNAQMGMKGSVAASQWVSTTFHNTAWSRPNPVNTANWHNSMHASGRGHPGWHDADTRYGYGQVPDDRFNCLPPHEYHVAPMYAQPLYNINPAFYNIPNFQMWHTPAGFNNNSMNIAPLGPPKGMNSRFEHVSTEFSIQFSIRKQIEYYFSNENLHKDKYLKSLMDNEGYVPVSLIARFNRMRELTSSHPVILEALKNSSVVEVKGEKIRRAGDWRAFLSSLSSSSETSHRDTSVSQNSCEPPSSCVLLNNGATLIRNTVSGKEGSSSSSLHRGESDDSLLPSAAVLLNNDPTLIPKTVAEQDSSSNPSLHRGDSNDSHLTMEEKKEMNLLCSTNSSLVNEDNCSSLDDPVTPSLSQGKTKDSVEMNESRFVEVSHSQLSSYIAVP